MRALSTVPPALDGRLPGFVPRGVLLTAAWLAAALVAAALWLGLRRWSEGQVILPPPSLGVLVSSPLDRAA